MIYLMHYDKRAKRSVFVQQSWRDWRGLPAPGWHMSWGSRTVGSAVVWRGGELQRNHVYTLYHRIPFRRPADGR